MTTILLEFDHSAVVHGKVEILFKRDDMLYTVVIIVDHVHEKYILTFFIWQYTI